MGDLSRKKRLERASFKRRGHDWNPIVKHKGHRIHLNGKRSNEWRAFREDYIRKLPNRVRCHYCRKPFDKGYITLDHKNGRAGILLVDESNIVPACYKCNRDKGSKSYKKYMAQIGRAIIE